MMPSLAALRLSVPIAYAVIVVIWSTTPLAIKWSSEGPGYLFGVVSRMVIGTACVLALTRILRKPIAWDSRALHTYSVSAAAIYGAMLAVYWGAQYIPSGWISVIFGLTPIVTAAMAAVWLDEPVLTWRRLAAMLLGFCGLAIMFNSALDLGVQALLGIAMVLLAVIIFAASTVWVKRLGPHLAALPVTAGGLLLALPPYLLTWWLLDGRWPANIPVRSGLSIVYLGVVATAAGFALYYYVLRHLPTVRVALITLVTPVFALILGHSINDEPLSVRVWLGAGMVMLALILHEVLPALVRTREVAENAQ